MSELDIDDPLYEEPGGARPKRRQEPFTQITHSALISGTTALHSAKQLAVWVFIHYRVWLEKRKTIIVSNEALTAWGIDRRTKYAALRRLAAAGLIRVESWGSDEGRSPTITVT